MIRNPKQEGYEYRLKNARSYAIHAKDFLAISENFENFHVELASQPILSYRRGGTQHGQKMKNA